MALIKNSPRSSVENCCAILSCAIKPIRKTHIQYKAEVGYVAVTKFLDLLCDRGLMTKTEIKSRRDTKQQRFLFQTTESGLRFVKEWKKLKWMWNYPQLEKEEMSLVQSRSRKRYRNRLQIIADMLSIVSEGAKKTRIMYKANLSYKLLCRYLRQMLEQKLLVYDNVSRVYQVTPRAKEFLAKYKEYSAHCDIIEKQIGDINNRKSLLEEMCQG